MSPVLATIDFSPVSRAVAQEALILGTALGQPVIFLHVLAPFPRIEDPSTDRGEVLACGERNAERQLEKFAAVLCPLGSPVQRVIATGMATEEILREARARAAGHLVMGSRGHSRVHDVLLGSTALAILRATPCPVVILRARSPGPVAS